MTLTEMEQEYERRFGSAVGSEAASDADSAPACKYFFTSGRCNKGDACRYQHVAPLCRYFASTGHCRDGDACRFQHPSHILATQEPVNHVSEETEPSVQPPPHAALAVQSPAPASQMPAPSPAVIQYTVDELGALGRQMTARLPPASAVQAMFLYEMQRQSEVESLFHAQMFRMASAEDVNNSTVARIEKLEADFKKAQQQLDAKDVQERLATSKVRFVAQQARIESANKKLEEQADSISKLKERLAAMESDKAAGKSTDAAEQGVNKDIGEVRDDVENLYGERDCLLGMLTESKSRISKLEDLVRHLTFQVSTVVSPRSSSPALSQRVPVQTTNGQTIGISVPKGSGLNGNKENRAPGRSFDGW